MYESTMDALVNLYPKLSPGGFAIIDDWGVIEGCRLAVNDYRKQNNITEEIISIDQDGVYWRKSIPPKQ
jgi:O-methyltransferase